MTHEIGVVTGAVECSCGQVFRATRSSRAISLARRHVRQAPAEERRAAHAELALRRQDARQREYDALTIQRLEVLTPVGATTRECAAAWGISADCARRWLWRREARGYVLFQWRGPRLGWTWLRVGAA